MLPKEMPSDGKLSGVISPLETGCLRKIRFLSEQFGMLQLVGKANWVSGVT